MGAVVIACLVTFVFLVFASGQQYSNPYIPLKLSNSSGAVQNTSLGPIVQSAYATFSRHTAQKDTRGSSFNDLSSYGSQNPKKQLSPSDIDLTPSHSDYNYNAYQTDDPASYYNGDDENESGEDEQTFYNDLNSYKHYKSSATQAHEGPYQVETIDTQSYHKKVPAFDVSEFAQKDEDHQEKGEVHYHQHKHVHKHEHKQEHVHQHKQEHKHEHGHKHKHTGHHEHKHNAQHKHQHHSDHKHQHQGSHKHEHHSEHKHQHHGNHKHQHHSNHKHEHHGEHKHQHNSEHKHQHHGQHKHQHHNKHHHDHKHHDDHKHTHNHDGHK